MHNDPIDVCTYVVYQFMCISMHFAAVIGLIGEVVFLFKVALNSDVSILLTHTWTPSRQEGGREGERDHQDCYRVSVSS